MIEEKHMEFFVIRETLSPSNWWRKVEEAMEVMQPIFNTIRLLDCGLPTIGKGYMIWWTVETDLL